MSIYEFGPFHLDADQLLLSVADTPVPLGPKVVETLLALVEHPGEVLSKTAILDRVWPEGFVEEANLAQNIYVLRKVLRAQWDADPIATVPRRGYRFTAAVRSVERVHTHPDVVQPPVALPTRRVWWRPAGAAAAFVAAIAVAVVSIAATTHQRAADATVPQLSEKGARLYQIGRYYWNQRTAPGVEKSLTYFAQVVDADPHDARGYAALADANAIMGDYGYGRLKPRVYYGRAHAYAQKALTLDARSAEAVAVLGMLDLESMKPSAMPKGITLLRRAIALDPAYGPAHQWYGIALLGQGNIHAAMTELQTAAALDPLSVSTTAWLTTAAYLDRHYGEAIAYARQTLDLSPQRFDVLEDIGLAYEARGEYSQAIDAYKDFARKCKDCGPQAAALMAHAYAMAHDVRRARIELARAQAKPRDVDPEDLAVALAAMGDRRAALKLLNKITGDARHFVALDPRLDPFRRDGMFRVPVSPA